MSDAKSMGLYRNVDRITADLASVGISADDPLTVADLTPFDQYHYEGVDAVDDASVALGAAPGKRILDVGSGLGGPARHMAATTGARVTALELQSDLNETAASLTQRCGLQDQVEHLNGDMLADAADEAGFDGLMSMLCVLHIADRDALFRACSRALRAGGGLFVDDFVARGPLSEEERSALAQKVWCPYLPDETTYVATVEAAGFRSVQVVDKTDDWTEFVTSRYEAFTLAAPELKLRYDPVTVEGLDDFYATVAGLFSNGHLGGLRLTARSGA